MRVPQRKADEKIVPLFLGGLHQLLTADGKLTPVQELPMDKPIQAIGWFVNQRREQSIIISKAEKHPTLWHAISKDGREIICGSPTNFLADKGKWVTFKARPDRKRIKRINIPTKTVNTLALYGNDHKSNHWVDAMAVSLLTPSRSNSRRPFLNIPRYLCRLNSSTLNALLERVITLSGEKLDLDRIDFDDQQRLFHLFDRIRMYRCVAKRASRVGFGYVSSKTSSLRAIRPTRTAKLRPKNSSILCEDPLQRYHPLVHKQEAFYITSDLGNIIDRSYICQTKINNSRS